MSKEWKCADCVKYKTDACSTCACGYTPTVSCRDVLVDYDYAYQQGRADAIKDTELFREIFLEDLINQSVDREEAIMYRNICEMSWSKYWEQLKEQKNGENVKEDTHLTLACLYTMATKGNFQNHKYDIAQIMQRVLDLDRVVRKEQKND